MAFINWGINSIEENMKSGKLPIDFRSHLKIDTINEAVLNWTQAARKSIDATLEVHYPLPTSTFIKTITSRETGALRFIPDDLDVSLNSFVKRFDHFFIDQAFDLSFEDIHACDRILYDQVRQFIASLSDFISPLDSKIFSRIKLGRGKLDQDFDYSKEDMVISLTISGERKLKLKTGMISAKAGEVILSVPGEDKSFSTSSSFMALEFIIKEISFEEQLKYEFLDDIFTQVGETPLPYFYKNEKKHPIPKDLKNLYKFIKLSAKDIDLALMLNRFYLEKISSQGLAKLPPPLEINIDRIKELKPIMPNQILWSPLAHKKHMTIAAGGYSAVIENRKEILSLINRINSAEVIKPQHEVKMVSDKIAPKILSIIRLLSSMGVFENNDRFHFKTDRPINIKDFDGGIFSARVDRTVN